MEIYTASCVTAGHTQGAYSSLAAAKQAIEGLYSTMRKIAFDNENCAISIDDVCGRMRWTQPGSHFWIWVDVENTNPETRRDTPDGVMSYCCIHQTTLNAAIEIV